MTLRDWECPCGEENAYPFSSHGWVAAPTLSRAAPSHLSTRGGTHAHCFEVGTSPGRPRWAQGQEQVELSLPLSQGGSERGPIIPPHTLARISLLWALPLPLLLFRLPNYQAEVAFWFALFLYVKYPQSPISHIQYQLGHRSSPLNATPSPPTCHRKQVRSGVTSLRWEVGTPPCLIPLSDPQCALL